MSRINKDRIREFEENTQKVEMGFFSAWSMLKKKKKKKRKECQELIKTG